MSLLWEGVREGCGTCKFWWASGDQGLGSCKRRPPVIVAVSRLDPWGKTRHEAEQHVPIMHQEDWCGEYDRKDHRS